ncbi:uncharacterized protein F5147DRAFT_616508 [Suillus discolor]|uniref:Vacuolar sorting protein Vps3844 C-terminal domain-containing protein n=1 Tax=Suillus discolor TaxID=1912936 RepID=A0A9P7F1P5_9AGAM|nr:uncharacterized protein F5147DRAFT_616508 [Suillus discolor]KAG2101310.1 hypothetical protein F5147DRAFT_616508 [Suillus discolor]
MGRRLCSALSCLLLAGLSQAADVYLSPSQEFPSRLSLQHADFALSQHLGLEPIENFQNYGELLREQEFVAQGASNALFLLVNDASLQDITPSFMSRSFSIAGASTSSLTSFVPSYLKRATHSYSLVYSDLAIPPEGIPRTLDIFSAPTPANEAFLAEISTLTKFIETAADLYDDKFASLELTGLSQLAATYGRSSDQYQLAARTIRAVLEASTADAKMRVAVLSYTPSLMLDKRQPQPPQQSPLPGLRPSVGPPIRQFASCLTSAEACSNATNACSGHGQCVSTPSAEQECFVCACSDTKSASGKTESWVGDMCQRKDISSTFVLIAGTVITLILLMGGSISLLYSIGGDELPSILTGGVASGLRKE